MFNSCAALRPYIAHIDDIYKDFTSYKYRVPVTGAIILDESYDRVISLDCYFPVLSFCIIVLLFVFCVKYDNPLDLPNPLIFYGLISQLSEANIGLTVCR